MESLIHNLGIDWKLLGFQVINFAILLYVLRRFLFKPLLKIIDERKKKIEEGLKFSEQVEKDVKEIQEKRGHILAEAHKKADLEIEAAKKIAEEKQKEIMEDADQKAQDILMMAKVEANDERQKIVRGSRQDILDLAFSVAAKVMAKKIGERDDKKLTEEFIKNM